MRQVRTRAAGDGATSRLVEVFQFGAIGTVPINNPLNVVMWSPTPFGLGRDCFWLSQGSQLPRALLFIFSLCCSQNNHSRAAHSFFKIGHLFSHFFCLSLARFRLLILLLLLSGNVHLNPGPHVYLLSVRWKCDLVGQVSAMLYRLQMGPTKMLTAFSFQIQNSW